MEMEEKLKWLEVRINSSLRQRNEDIKNMMHNDENRLAVNEFLNNEDVHRLFIFLRAPKEIIASLTPPVNLTAKSVFFMKNNAGVKLTKDNMNDEITYLDCGTAPVEQLDTLIREIYLPLMCTEQQLATAHGVSADKLLDILHRLMASLEVGQGHIKGKISLPLPSIEVLAEAAATASRRSSVLHVLETTVIGWIKQIKGLLKHDPINDLLRQAGPHPGPLDEVQLWATRLKKLHSVNEQLDSPVAADILRNLDEACSTYASSFSQVRKDIYKAIHETEETLRFLSTMHPWFLDLHDCLNPQRLVRLFPPLIHNLLLVWSHSNYYHQPDNFHNLLRLISNEVVHRAEAMVGEDVLREPLESYTKLKEALRVCAAFRGTYLDYRDKSEEVNEANVKEHAEKMIQRPQGANVLFSTKMYGSNAYQPKYGLKVGTAEEVEEAMRMEELWQDSPWPPRNAPAFDLLNAFMERCNDVLELVQTTRHFRLLSDAAEVGGAGSASLDALVKEIHQKYTVAMADFFSRVSNVLSIDGSQGFEDAFFNFRSIVKDLERKLANVLRQSFQHCPTIGSQLRLLEVFEGISGRELVQKHLRDKDQALVQSFTDELIKVRSMFHSSHKRPPLHKNMPPFVSRLLWIHALKERVQIPMNKMRQVCPQLLDGDMGWQLRDAYAEAISDFEKYETRILGDWTNRVTAELSEGLKQTLMVAEEYEEDEDVRPQAVHVNLDPKLLLLLREIHYVRQEPFTLTLPSQARELVRNTDVGELRVTSSRLETIVSKYNTVMKGITEFELPLFERKLAKIDHLFDQGLNQLTWRTEEKADFIETATALVCSDLHSNLDIVQTNCHEVAEITLSWSKGTLDVFAARDPIMSYPIDELVTLQQSLNEDLENSVMPSGHKIHALLQSSFKAVQMSSASPAWQDYVDYIDAIVLDGLKQACLTSLKSMLNQIVKANINEDDTVPILKVRLELIENKVAFRPPLDESTSSKSVQETVSAWLNSFLARGNLVQMLGGKGSYADYMAVDEEVQQLVEHIEKLVKDNAEECGTLYELFTDYAFLWQLDVNQTFDEFLQGKVSPNPMRNSSKFSTLTPSNLRMLASAKSNHSRASSAKSSLESAGIVGTAERSFLQPKQAKQIEAEVPTLDEFDNEIDIFKTARDDIVSLQDYKDVGWLRVDLTPIKQVLTTYASKWMWTFTKYLSDQVSDMLEKLDNFLKRIEPEIEGITGEERDTASFMKMMRLFNEVSAQQSEMDGKFAAMHRTVLLVKKYGQQLPDNTQQLFDAAPARWSSLKTKVSLAKQRLGPRIQEESKRITQDLEAFGERVNQLHQELEASEVYSRECSLGESWVLIENFISRLEVLENEAQDLIELQDLLETSVVNFSILPQCHQDLTNLKSVWETVRVIDERQSEWKRHRWQKMNTKILRDETNRQMSVVRGLPDDVFTWDVYMGLIESITNIQDCLPLIDDLSNPAMRTRHWKQLVRVTGGAVQVDNDTLKRMTLGELLSLGLQKHVDDVRAIVQRAGKDLSIEQSLKTYEEVWLSKVFESREHIRHQTSSASHSGEQDNQSEMSELTAMPVASSRTQLRAASRISNQSSVGRPRRGSVCSLPNSLLNLGEDSGLLTLLTNTDPIFDELENHQVALQAMQSSSAAGSFLDEVIKWQKRLQTVEAVLTTWLEVQEKWVELEEVFSSQDIRMALAQDANIFSAVNRDFRLLMRASEKNPNVLQCCQRKNILLILEKMNYDLEHCRRSLLLYLERRRQIFPRFYFLSMEDVLHIVCNGYDVEQVNMYIGKLLENVGRLVYEETEEGEQSHFNIIAISSRLNENLPFKQPMVCEGQIESWLTALLQSIKSALQYQVATATGLEKRRPTRVIYSAGARRVSLTEKKISGRLNKDKTGSRAASRVGSRQALQRTASGAQTEMDTTPLEKSEKGSRSWILDHVTEVVYLVTKIQTTTLIEEALKNLNEGKEQALEDCKSSITAKIRSSTNMLRGLEGDKETVQKRIESAKNSLTERSHSATETGSQLRGTQSKLGSTMELDNQPIPEEDAQPRNDQDSTSLGGPPADTMTLLAMPMARNESEEEEEEDDPMISTYHKLLLFPSQIHKLSTIIALMAHERDLVGRLQQAQEEAAGPPLSNSFDWCSQLHYSMDNETRAVNIKCLEQVFEYGFEYLGSGQREVLTPLTERAFLTFTQAIKTHSGGLCMGSACTPRLGIVLEFGKALGKPMYTFNCTKSLDSIALHDIFKGLATTGSWICLNNINNMLPEVLSVCAQLVTAVYDALKSSKAKVHFPGEEVQLTQGGACFSVIDSGIKVRANNPEKLLLYNSIASNLPDELMSQFRTVSMLTPDIKLTLEILLISKGFQWASDLAQKTLLLFNMCSALSGTNAPMMNVTDHLTYNSLSISMGWSQQILQFVAFEAGAILDKTIAAWVKQHDVLGGDVLVPGEDGLNGLPISASREEEEEAVILALRNTYMPRLLDRDASIFTTLLHDLWPEVDIPMLLGGNRQTPDIDMVTKSRSESHISKSISKPKSGADGRSYKVLDESINLNTPAVPVDSGLGDRYLMEQEKQVMTDINDAIAVATANLGLIPGAAYQARVSQLAELNTAHKTVIVAGPAACGKSETIKTFALAERERGKQMVIQSVFTKAVESDELLGYWDLHTKEWRDGLVPCLLRKFCLQSSVLDNKDNEKPVMNVLLLDGELDAGQFELMETILHNNGSVVLGNNERILMPDNLRFFWEVETLSCLTPAILANVGVLVMTSRDVGWQMQLAMWVEQCREGDREVLRRLCEQYVETMVEYLEETTRAEMIGPAPATKSHYKRVIWQSNEAYIHTFTAIFDALTVHYTDLTEVELERYFNYALIWAFGGTLEVRFRDHFSTWWKNTFPNDHCFPSSGTVFDYVLDNESHEMVRWSDILPSYTGAPHVGIPPDAFVHSGCSEQLLHLLGVLTDAGKAVMLVGERGCGKSSIVNERIRTVCSGEVAEVLGLTINTNRFTNSNLLYKRLDDRLEWKHGRTYVPKGNKRLLCLIDDINLAQVDEFSKQTATELVRQHIDDGGFYDLTTHTWRYVKNVTYVTTVNPTTTAIVPKLSSRLLRHFAIFGCPYPSTSELHSIFSTLLYTHFITPELTSAGATSGSHHLGIMDETVRHVEKEEEEALKSLLSLIVSVTLELHDRLRTMYLPTANRCHYVFTMQDIGTIFSNLCLSLRPSCSRDTLLLLWEHECEWVYGRRMVNEIDIDRYHQSFLTAVRKEFTQEEYISLLSQHEKPVFTNLMEQDSGLVVAGHLLSNNNKADISEEEAKTDLYHSTYNVSELRRLVDHGVEEYNKTHPRIKLDLYKVVLEQVCRLARVFASPHEVAHCALIAEGCPGRAVLIANLASNLCGFSVFKINPSPISCPSEYKMDTFKAELVAAYTRAGVKGEQLIFLLEEEELQEEDFLVSLTEFIVSGDITHLFSQEEMTTIINSIRTEVTQAGLTYTREVAWEFFLSTVKRNFRVCLVMCGSGQDFQRRCRQYPALVHNINFVCFPHWNKRQLIKHSAYHLKHVKWMDKVQRENLAHLQATMHIVLRQQDGQELGCGQFKHITNTGFEKFVERFISMINARHTEIRDNHSAMEAMNKQVQMENQLATRLRKQLEHEKVVLLERRAGTIRILSQIGQDTAITEQQIKIVKAQMEKITRLKKLLPEYQVAHERAVFKAIAIVADTKKVVQNMNIESLSELRAMQKPTIDIEDLMAAVIMILKTPQADLTWQKGAKRQMANLERFIEELMSFDDNVLPENTLSLVEPYLKKASFDPDTLEQKTSISACGALCRWVRGVCRYNRMMISKVKPLHKKVEETTQAIDGAEHRMVVLDNKRKALEVRLSDLAKGFEEATIDKNDQLEKTLKMEKSLETAGRLRRILRQEQSRIQQVLNSLPHRLAAIPGGVAMAAAFVIYLGPYHYNFRRLMLTVHWPNCLRERGVPLVIDSIDSTRGRVVDWAVDALKTASGASGTDIQEDYLEEMEDDEEEDSDEQDALVMEPDSEADAAVLGGETEETEETEKDDSQPENANKERGEKSTVAETNEEEDEDEDEDDDEEEYSEGHSQPDGDSEDTTVTMPIISSEQFNRYVVSLIKLLVGEKTLMEWTKKDFGPRQLENAAILYSSWQRPVMFIDPYGEGQLYLQSLNPSMNRKPLVQLNMDTRSDPQVIMSIEKCIMKGQPVLLANCSEQLDTMISPIIHHRNTAHQYEASEDPRMIKYCGRRILCNQDFRLYMATSNPKPAFTSTVASTTTLINYTTSNETLVDDLLIRAFARIRPELYTDRRLGLKSIFTYKQVLVEVQEYSKQRIRPDTTKAPRREMFCENDVDMIADLTAKKRQMTEEITAVQNHLDELDTLRDELFPIARRGTMLYAILRSLATLRREYHFSLSFFMQLFDEAIGGAFPPEFMEDSDYEDEYDDESMDGHRDMGGRSATPASNRSMADSHTPRSGAGSAVPSAQAETIEEQTTSEYTAAETEKEQYDEVSSPDKDHRATKTTEREPTSIITVPEVPRLPSEGVEYANLADNQIKQIVETLTSLVYHRVKESLLEEHRLLFATLLCLNIQEESGEHFSEEEISLLLQGVPSVDLHLTLADFECEESPPSWLPSEKWDDIMALSVMPGPLDGLCVHIASNPEDWKAWYRSPCPERDALPLRGSGSDKEDTDEKSTSATTAQEEKFESTEPDISDFHRLLLLRMLRPDRLPIAMTDYINHHLDVSESEESRLQPSHLINTNNHHGILLLQPPKSMDGDSFTLSSIKNFISPINHITKMAESMGVAVEVLVLGEGREAAVHEALSAAERNSSWVIIDKLHLGTPKFLRDLRLQLHRIHKARGEEEGSGHHFMAWLTAVPNDTVPLELIHVLYTLSWDVFTRFEEAKSETADQEQNDTQHETQFMSTLSNTISAALKSLPASCVERVSRLSLSLKQIVYAVGVVQGLLIARQMLGTRGMSQFYPITQAQYENVVNILLSDCFTNVSGEALIDQACRAMTDAVYNQMVSSAWDRRYIEALVQHVVPSIVDSQEVEVKIGAMNIPVPPANVEPADFGSWFDSKMAEVPILKGLNLYSNVERTVNSAFASEFLRSLETLYEAQNMDLGDISTACKKPLNLLRLRAILDSILEQLPPLLDLGHVPETLVDHDYDFPYHRPSLVSVASKDSILMPETIGFVLLQECMWLNSLLCHIRQNVHEVYQCLLAGPESFPYDLKVIINSMDAEHVPTSWLHPNTQPSTHCLSSWQQHLKKRYAQMHLWLKQGMVPIFQDGHATPVSHGSLRSVWLGGLVNPGALFTALCQEKAVLANTFVNEVTLAADVSQSFNEDTYDIVDEGGLYVRGLKIEGATWDLKKNCLKEANQSTDINSLPSVYVRPVLKTDEMSRPETSEKKETSKDSESKGGEKEYERTVYDCPVFMNRARQVCAFVLPLSTEGSPDRWTRAGTAVILDSGVPEDGAKKSRAFAAPKAVPLTARMNESLGSLESQAQSQTIRPAEESESDGGVSKQSQLSYKAMSPKASPLPAELTMIRESHVSRTSYVEKKSLKSVSLKSQPGPEYLRESKESLDRASQRSAGSQTRSAMSKTVPTTNGRDSITSSAVQNGNLNSTPTQAESSQQPPTSKQGSRPGSLSGSRAGSQPTSRAGSLNGSRAGSLNGSRAGSRAGSKLGSRPASLAGSLQDSRPNTPRSLTKQRREGPVHLPTSSEQS